MPFQEGVHMHHMTFIHSNSNGQAVCSSGHGGSFGTDGNVINGPPNASLESYSTSLIENQLTITK